MSGADMIFDLVEVALGHKPLEDTDIDSHSPDLCAARTILVHALDTLRELAAEIVALSLVRIILAYKHELMKWFSAGHRIL